MWAPELNTSAMKATFWSDQLNEVAYPRDFTLSSLQYADVSTSGIISTHETGLTIPLGFQFWSVDSQQKFPMPN